VGGDAEARRAPAWLDELRLEPGPPFLAMGTRALDPATWLVVDDDHPRDLERKRRLLAGRRAHVVALGEGADDASAELLDLVRAWLAAHATGVGRAPAVAGEHPLVAAALSVQEDLVLLRRREDAWVVAAGAVCFPSRWSIADKVGRPLAGVHAGVEHYDRELRERVDRFHDRLAVDRPVWRRNWFVYPTDELHLTPDVHVPPPCAVAADGSPLWIRSERQTLRRLPRSGAIAFTIRVQRAPLGVLRDRPDVARRMLQAVRSWDAPTRASASTAEVLAPLTTWLEGLT